MKILLCGGAGYIGSHMLRALLKAGHEAIVYDNLFTGSLNAVKKAAQPLGFDGETIFVKGDVTDEEGLKKVFAAHKFDAVMHFSSRNLVHESIASPGDYYHNIFVGSLNLLKTMKDFGVDKFVFSSTAAVYGAPEQMPLSEDSPTDPLHPYGKATRMVEIILEDYGRAHGLKSSALRYFNAAGADPDGGLGESSESETRLISSILRAILGQRPKLEVYGNDYPTPDGTTIRDYVHVCDLVEAHLLSLKFLAEQKEPGFEVFNLGTGKGFSVMEIMASAERVSGQWAPYNFGHRRPGDPPILVASAEKAKNILGWQPQFTSIDDIMTTAWNWHRSQ